MDEQRGEGLISRGLRSLREAWHEIAGGEAADEGDGSRLSARRVKRLRQTLSDCVREVGGEVSARARAAQLGEAYLGLDDAGKRHFLQFIADEFGPPREAVEACIRAYQKAGPDELAAAEQQLWEALKSPRVRIFTQFNALPQGVKFLVDMRADVLRFLPDRPRLAVLDRELGSLLASWFDVGFLDLRRITWNSSASLLEKFIAYEAVHEIRSWSDLRNRLDSDRRCYAFFHPRMPEEPLIFVEVALVQKIADNIHVLLDEKLPPGDPRKADTAVFYSISNTQRGLRGVSFGNFLLKRVVDDLSRDFPKLKNFVTLSPLPLFRRWLDADLEKRGADLLLPAERKKLSEISGLEDAGEGLRRLLSGNTWTASRSQAAALRPLLLRLCAHYLVNAKSGSRPFDPVARFHLGNGARIERINWLADTSPKGLRQAAGIMVNYQYDLADIEANHERFAHDGEVAVSASVRVLLKQSKSA